MAGGGRDRPERPADKERGEGRARQPGRGTRRWQPASPADRKAAGCPLPPGGVIASVTMNPHRSLLTPCQTTNASPSRPPPVPGPDLGPRPFTWGSKAHISHAAAPWGTSKPQGCLVVNYFPGGPLSCTSIIA